VAEANALTREKRRRAVYLRAWAGKFRTGMHFC